MTEALRYREVFSGRRFRFRGAEPLIINQHLSIIDAAAAQSPLARPIITIITSVLSHRRMSR